MNAVSSFSRNARVYVLALLTTVYAFNVLDRFILGILLPYIKREMDLNDTILGLLTGPAFAIFFATLSMPIARLSDRYARKYVIAICLFLFSLMTSICGLAGGFWQLFLARIGVGIGEAGTMPASASILADIYSKEKRSSAMSFLSFGANIGAMIAFMVGGIVAAQYGWRAGFFVVGIPGMVFAFVILFTLREPVRGNADNQAVSGGVTPSFRACLDFLKGQKSYWLLSLGFAIMIAMSTANMVWIISFFERSHGLTTDVTGPIMGLGFGLGGAVGTILIGGYISDHFAKRDLRLSLVVIAIGAVILAIGQTLVLLAPTGTWALIAMIIPGLLGIFFQGPILALTQAVAPIQMRATASAISLFIVNILGLGMGPPIVGIASDLLMPHFGDESLRIALIFTPLMSLLGAAMFLATRKSLLENIARAERYV